MSTYKKTYILIDLDGKEATRLDRWEDHPQTWVWWQGRKFGFGVANLSGDCFFYEIAMRSPLQCLGTSEGKQ